MMMGFAKVFDRDPRTMSLRNLLDTTQRQMELAPRLTQKDLDDMNAHLSEHETSVEILKYLRDQKLAHLDAMPRPLSPLQKGQVDGLVATVGDVFNRLSAGHDGSFYDWSFQRKDSAELTDRMLTILQEEMDSRRVELNRRLVQLRLDDREGEGSTDA